MLLLERPTLVLNRNWVPIHTLPARIAIGLVARGSAQIIDPESYEVHDLLSWDAASRAREVAARHSGRARIHSSRKSSAGESSSELTADPDASPSDCEEGGADGGKTADRAFTMERIRSARLELAPLEVIVLTDYTGVGDKTVTFSRLNLYRRDRYTCQYCGSRPGSKELTIDHVLPRSRGGGLSWVNCVLACVSCNKRKGSRTPEEAGMRLGTAPVRPHWQKIRRFPERPTYKSWERFLSDAYWSIELKD